MFQITSDFFAASASWYYLFEFPNHLVNPAVCLASNQELDSEQIARSDGDWYGKTFSLV